MLFNELAKYVFPSSVIRRFALAFLILTFATQVSADDRFVLQYDAPANETQAVKKGKGKKSPKLGFIQTALPLGNGRLGAMFSGGIDTEHLLINDITL